MLKYFRINNLFAFSAERVEQLVALHAADQSPESIARRTKLSIVMGSKIRARYFSMLIICVYAILTLRAIAMSYVYLAKPALIPIYTQVDPILSTVNELFSNGNSIWALCLSPFNLFAIYTEYLIWLKVWKPSYFYLGF